MSKRIGFSNADARLTLLAFGLCCGLSLPVGAQEAQEESQAQAVPSVCSVFQTCDGDAGCERDALQDLDARLAERVQSLTDKLQALPQPDAGQGATQSDSMAPADLFAKSQSFWAKSRKLACDAEAAEDQQLCLCDTATQRTAELEAVISALTALE